MEKMAQKIDTILMKFGGKEKVIKILKNGSKNKKWIKEQYEKLKEDYLMKFVAVLDEEIIGKSENIKELLDFINKKYPKNNEIAIEYIGPARKVNYFL